MDNNKRTFESDRLADEAAARLRAKGKLPPEDWMAKENRKSNEALAKRAAKKQASPSTLDDKVEEDADAFTEIGKDRARKHASIGKSGKRVDDAGADDAEIKRLAALPLLQYEREYKPAAKKMDVRASVLEQLVKAERAKNSPLGKPRDFLAHWNVEPSSDAVNGAALLDDLRQQFTRYAVLPPQADVALALWVLHTWVFECFDITPYLTTTSPAVRCGKTIVMTLLYWLSYRGKKNDSMSKPAIYRSVESEKPTLVLDEVGWVVDGQDERQGILSGGFERNGFVEICEGEGENITTRRFSTYCPKAFGIIGKLTATLTDRSICINMQRKLKAKKVPRLRRRDNDEFATLRRRCLRWANDNAEALAQAPQQEHDGLNDRALDFWEPLLTVADAAGGEWPQAARMAALALSGDADGTDDSVIGVELLKDVRLAFGDDDVIRSVDLVAKLIADPERPWAEYNRGKPISQRQVARLLGAFHIISINVRPEIGTQGKGYRRVDFRGAWEAYCPAKSSRAPEKEKFIRPSVPKPVDIEQVSDFASVPEAPWDGSKNSNLSYSHAGLDGWTDKKPKHGEQTTSAKVETPSGDPNDIPSTQRICAQCNADGEPLRKLKGSNPTVWLHPECKQFWLRDHNKTNGKPTKTWLVSALEPADHEILAYWQIGLMLEDDWREVRAHARLREVLIEMVSPEAVEREFNLVMQAFNRLLSDSDQPQTEIENPDKTP
jgi:hypothetical protein